MRSLRLKMFVLAPPLIVAIVVGGLLAREAFSNSATDMELARLEPTFRAALSAAFEDAGREGITIEITSGRRTMEQQQKLFDNAVVEYGSAEEASRWVMRPDNNSPHLAGKAVDVAPKRAAAWLRSNGVRYGLCQVYANEAWHFELTARNGRCPALLLDATSSYPR